jgi:hypothetical protein
MAYVRKKKVGDYSYYQIVESRRVNGVPRQRVLVHLGEYSSVEEALRGWPEDIEIARWGAEDARERREARSPPRPGRSYEEEETRLLRRAERLEKNLEILKDLVERGVVERTARAKEEKHGEKEG